jgi:hypothetical protein
MMADYVESLSNEQIDNALRVIGNLKLAGKSLNPVQMKYAIEVANKAANMGISPDLAVAMAYHESIGSFDPSLVGKDGEIGIMQVMPTTAEGMGFNPKELKKNPDQQIDAGLRYLKQQLDAHENDPHLALIAYNKGADHPFFKGGKLPDVTKQYLDHVESMGGFGAPAQAVESNPIETPVESEKVSSEISQEDQLSPQQELDPDLQRNFVPRVSSPPPTPSGIATPAEIGERLEAGLLGGLTGLGVSGVIGSRGILNKAGEVLGRGLTQGSQQAGALQAVAPPTTPPGVLGETAPAGTIETAPQNQFERSIQGAVNEQGTTGRQRQNVYNTETGRQAAQRRNVQNVFTRNTWNATPQGVLFPEQNAYTGPRGPQGEIGGGKPPPVEPIPSVEPTVPKAGSLERVTGILQSLINNPITRYASKLRILTPPLALAGAGERAAEVAQELRNPNPDYTSALLKGGSAAGMALTPFAPEIGLPLTGLSEGALYLRGNSPKGTFSYENPTGQTPR